jgi:hypothetical protein
MVVDQTPPNRGAQPEFKIMDSVALLLNLLLAVAGMLLDNMLAVGVLLALATVILCYAISRHSEVAIKYRMAICALCALGFGVLFAVLKSEHDARELEKNEGLLIPAHHKRPTTRCPVGDDDFAIYAGGGAVYGSSRPQVLLSIGGQEIITGEPLQDGSIRLKTIRLFDEDGDILVRITDDKFWVHPLARRERPDFSTLIVYDKKDVAVLKLEFLDHNSIRINGVFRVPRRPPVIISDASITVGPLTVSGMCARDVRTGLSL